MKVYACPLIIAKRAVLTMILITTSSSDGGRKSTEGSISATNSVAFGSIFGTRVELSMMGWYVCERSDTNTGAFIRA